MKLEFVTVETNEFERLFDAVKQGLFTYVDKVFGWDDDFQRERLKNSYQSSWFHWVVKGKEQVALACFKPYENALHLHFLIVFPDRQRKGIGQQVMAQIEQMAKGAGCEKVTLSSFVVNSDATSLYQKLGYQVVEQDEAFLSMALNLKE